MLVLAWAVATLVHPVLHAVQHSEAGETCYLCLTLHSAAPALAASPLGESLGGGESVILAAPTLALPAASYLVAPRAPPAGAL